MTAHAPAAASILRRVPFRNEIQRAAGGQRIYLVGGAVRDAILGRSTPDFDFVVHGAHQVAARLARALRGALVPLHDEFPTARVVVLQEGRRVELDFADPRARSLRGDLAGRDFTMNAIAAGPLGAHPRTIDPCHGREDIRRRVIRMASEDSLVEDPLRILRAYRFASQLGFRIEPRTRRRCRKLAGLVPRAAAERVGVEVMALCAGDGYPIALEAAASDGVLGAVMPEFERTAGVEQLGVHEFDVATHSVLTAVRLAGVMDEAQHLFPGHASEIDEYLCAPEVRAGVVLAALFHDLGKPECRTWEGQRWRFFGHAERGVGLAGGLMDRLRLPKRVRRQVTLLVGSHMRLIPYISTDDPTERAKRRLIRETAPDTIGLALLCIADWRALRRDGRVDDEELALDRLREILALAREMAAEGESIEPLLNGSDLLALGLEPGPLFARILRAVEEEWIAGNLNSKSEALAWVRSHWAGGDQQQTDGAETNRPGGKAGNGGPRSV